ncbi:hypothetical protein [Pedobacter endophyticus]|uniref:Bacterial Pleckstrin homology domain-containing protein n=1 Tax=Pedobacter endophyticus TaxID=2789740 RepID=A0A7S9PZW9_9SPHI|nr:hypothetical protein [Pedobacter endophyticus]QPH40131.1 hypothetical protein IZT61_02290 [Pedobacter endophyticus]
MEFEEKQALKIWWLYLVMGATTLPTIAILFSKYGPGLEGMKEMYFAPVFAALSPFLIVFLIQKSKLKLKLTEAGFSYRYFPFHIKTKVLDWAAIEKAYIRKYDAFSEYGGFGVGIRLWFKFSDRAYILNDKNKGLQLELKNGKKLLFSSNKIDEMELFLINLKIKYNIEAIR